MNIFPLKNFKNEKDKQKSKILIDITREREREMPSFVISSRDNFQISANQREIFCPLSEKHFKHIPERAIKGKQEKNDKSYSGIDALTVYHWAYILQLTNAHLPQHNIL